MAPRKRTLRDTDHETSASGTETPREPSLLQRIRNMWQFANLFQWIFLFGKVVKIDESIDIDVLETECLKPHSPILVDIGLALLKFVSSHRGLTADLFDEYTRRQYVARAPDHNPFGTDENPSRFKDFDILTKIKVLQQLTQWVMLHPERIREKMDEHRPTDQTEWRIEPYGWDRDDRTYYLLDDDRLYRKTDAPSPTSVWKPKKNTKKAKAAARAAKRRRISRSTAAHADDTDDGPATEAEDVPEPEDDGFGGAKWECVAVTLGEVQAFLGTIRKTRDENEKILRDRIEEGLVPILEKHEEARKRKELAREKELLMLEKMAHAKRSSRIADKAEKHRLEELAHEEEDKRRREEEAARREELKHRKLERERDNRLLSREARLREREARRRQQEEELAQLSEDSKHLNGDSAGHRISERHLQAEIDKKKQVLQQLQAEEEDWIFDCVCGVYGQIDDGTHSIACEKCNVWMHSKCVGISQDEADRDDFHFICSTCKRKMATPKPTVIKLKIKSPNDASSSPSIAKQPAQAPAQHRVVVEIPVKPVANPIVPPLTQSTGLQNPPSALNGVPLQQGAQYPPLHQSNIPVKQPGQPSTRPPPSPYNNSEGPNPFSSPHPTLSPPQQSPTKSRAYSTINSSSPSSAQTLVGEHKILPPKGIFHLSPKINGTTHQQQAPISLPTGVHAAIPTVSSPLDSNSSRNADPPINSSPAPLQSSVPRPSSAQQHRNSISSSVLSTPQLKHSQVGLNTNAGVVTPTLPPSHNGISPSKRSPPSVPHSSNGLHSTPAHPVLPPIAGLSPLPSQQIATPPIKPVEAARPPSQQTNGTFQGS